MDSANFEKEKLHKIALIISYIQVVQVYVRIYVIQNTKVVLFYKSSLWNFPSFYNDTYNNNIKFYKNIML